VTAIHRILRNPPCVREARFKEVRKGWESGGENPETAGVHGTGIEVGRLSAIEGEV